MPCNAKTVAISVPSQARQIEAAAASRSIVCGKCFWNRDGVCKVVAAKHGKEKANILDGVHRLSLDCPIGKWKSITTVCPHCGRSIVVNETTGVCKWCKQKHNTGRQNRVSYLPREVPQRIVKKPFVGEPVRNLYFFLYPRYLKSTLYHIEQLEKSADVFNGKKICCVAIDSETLQEQEQIRSRLEALFDTIIYIENDAAMRESAGFVESLEHLATLDPEQMVCIAHGKGQQVHTASNDIVRQWNDAMYETVVRNWKNAADAMELGYPLAGAFKSIGNFATTAHRWHYSGTFYWVRSQSFFGNKAWKQMCSQWFAAESYVGRHYADYEGFCLFGDHIHGGSMYKPYTWQRLEPELVVWRQENEHCRYT